MKEIFRKLNFFAGTFSFIFFIYTGIYLINKSYIKDDFWHMSARANHIYILMISLINFLFHKIKNNNTFLHDILSRIIVLLSAILCCFGFYMETGEKIGKRKIVPLSVGIVFFGVLLFLVTSNKNRKKIK